MSAPLKESGMRCLDHREMNATTPNRTKVAGTCRVHHLYSTYIGGSQLTFRHDTLLGCKPRHQSLPDDENSSSR